MVMLFRDQRLLHLFSGFPTSFSNYGGMTRAPARALLAGKLPDSIRLRRSGMPFCPDFYPRLAREAPEARARLPLFRRAGISDWLDLDWLERAPRATRSRLAPAGRSSVPDPAHR